MDTSIQNAEGWWKSVAGHIFQKSNSHIRMTWRSFRTDDPKHLVATVTWRPELAYPWSKLSHTIRFGPHRFVSASKSGPTISSSFFQYYYFLVTPFKYSIAFHSLQILQIIIFVTVTFPWSLYCVVRGSNPGRGEIFRTHPDRPWGPPSLLYNGYRVFYGGKVAGAWCWSPTPSSAEVEHE
jgi:hypothetical protein